MLKTSHQITVADGTKEDRRETRLSVQHWLTSPSTGIGFNSKSQMPPTHIRGQGALPFSVKLISNLLHPSLSVSYSPTIPTPLLSGRWFVSFTERKNKINFLQPLTKTHTSLLISAFLCPLLSSESGGCWSSQLSESHLLSHSRETTLSVILFLASSMFQLKTPISVNYTQLS